MRLMHVLAMIVSRGDFKGDLRRVIKR